MSVTAGRWSDLGPRLLTGGIAAAVGLALMWLGGLPFHALVALAAGVMVWELARMLGAGNRGVYLGVLATVMLLVAADLPSLIAFPMLLLPPLLGLAALSDHRLAFAAYGLAVMVAAFGLVELRDQFGFVWMAWLALVVIATDILGYFAGKAIGGPKLWPRVSPKKTWSGTVAGWAAAACVGLIFLFSTHAGAGLMVISVLVSIAGQVGDIAESALKRRMGVKDSSNVLPGHGGLFDRFDAMLGASLFLFILERLVDFPPGSAGA